MANFRQEIRQLRERFHKAVKASGGEISREEGDTNFSPLLKTEWVRALAR
jgi:hypothetical protein